jgi:phytoene/squalene synthetase
MNNSNADPILAESITKAASKQTYYTIRFLADRERVADAYRAYAYFRWVDDVLDGEADSGFDRIAFLDQQQKLLDGCLRGDVITPTTSEEALLIHLIQGDTEMNSGLQIYLRSMMAVMKFDAGRRGKLISQFELNEYTHSLASAVTEALHYFIGHRCYSPHNEARYLAVTAAHITHMLRDTHDDIHAGYFNIPREVLEANHISPHDTDSAVHRDWVRGRVLLARENFKTGKEHLAQVESLRCRLAGFAYTARFESVLDIIERDGYTLRPVYPERKVLGTLLAAGRVLLTSRIDKRVEQVTAASFPAKSHAQNES